MGTAVPDTSATGGSAATQAVDADARRWTPKHSVAVAIKAIAFLVPFVASALVARMLQEALGPTSTLPGHVLRWTGVILGSTAVLVTADRVTRRLLPIAALFQVAMVFPDRAPSRYKVALRTGSANRLAEQVRQGESLGGTPAEAAENALVLLNDLRAHDRLTRGHSERVRAYTDLIAEEMELPEADRDMLRWAALLHDVGKMSVPAEILNKPDRPTAAEWERLRQHPAAAARLLEPLEDWLGPWMGAATEHHERWDGAGYPLGLAGEQISLAGRVVAVADAYDCMTSARSYKKALPPDQARFELSRNAGTQFDPEVVRAFLNVSVGRLHLAGGPLAWLSSLPGVRDVATGLSGAAASASGAVAATGVAVVAATAGPVALPPAEPVPARPAAAVEVAAPAAQPGTATPGRPSGGSSGGSAGRGSDEAAAHDPSDETPVREHRTGTTSTTTTSPAGSRTRAPSPVTAVPTTRPRPAAPRPTVPPTTVPPPTARPPEVVGETASVKSSQQVDVPVLQNDTDPDGDLDPGSLVIVAGPAAGRAQVRGQQIRFAAPEASRAQQLLVRYRVCDRGGRCGEAVLKIVVTPNG